MFAQVAITGLARALCMKEFLDAAKADAAAATAAAVGRSSVVGRPSSTSQFNKS